MPVYEYHCKRCDKDFEELILGSSEDVKCPTCKGDDIQRILSIFGFKSESAFRSTSSSSCGGCSATSCSSCK